MQDERIEDKRLSMLGEWQLTNPDQDIRGRELTTAAGTALGTIRDMLVDTDRERVSAVVLEDGRTVPVENLEIRDDAVIAHDAGGARGPTLVAYEATLIRSNR